MNEAQIEPVERDITAMSSKERTDSILALRAKMAKDGSSSVSDKQITDVVKMIALERSFTKRTPKNKKKETGPVAKSAASFLD